MGKILGCSIRTYRAAAEANFSLIKEIGIFSLEERYLKAV
jgi:hypothetical protein